MVVYSFYIFDRHSKLGISDIPCQLSWTNSINLLEAECIYARTWLPSDRPLSSTGTTSVTNGASKPKRRDDNDNTAKLIFGTVFSLRNMVRRLGGEDDAFISYRTAQYKLHYYETPSNTRFVMLTDTATMSMRNVLHQIYINLWVEYGMLYPLSLSQMGNLG
jgi:hypothetical protein